ncbi:MAG: hypothetical protein H0X31_22865 [Nostocaceae cyanobacterium]|nr:hypothetical protein [Nostocaceae cyanobacterium]
MTPIDPKNVQISHIFHLIPVIGFFPALWTLYHRQGTREQLAVSRLSATLALSWLLGYILLDSGAAASDPSDFLTFRLLLLSSLLTSGYFLVSLWLIVRMLQHKSTRLPFFSRFAETMRSGEVGDRDSGDSPP